MRLRRRSSSKSTNLGTCRTAHAKAQPARAEAVGECGGAGRTQRELQTGPSRESRTHHVPDTIRRPVPQRTMSVQGSSATGASGSMLSPLCFTVQVLGSLSDAGASQWTPHWIYRHASRYDASSYACDHHPV
ncbi:uncharacterized protein LOC142580125 [Dermacentor variabilis]|uniref:uncharacterized protein LOC142580125 n=1 Tax=Dermacentor variabilis TaxID=34621 RepID=UPI003F5B208C